MKAVILAAGIGTRMRPLTNTKPKVMLPVANKPILEHLITAASKAGMREFIFIVGYREDLVREYFGDGGRWGVNITYMPQKEQLGTADALRIAAEFLDDTFLMLNGDTLLSEDDIRGVMALPGNALSIIEMKEVKDLGTVEVNGNLVTCIHEKLENPPTHLANAGLYKFTSDIFAAIAETPKSKRGEYEITDSIQLMLEEGVPFHHYTIKYWLDLRYPWDLLTANEMLLSKIQADNQGVFESGVTVKGPLRVGKGTTIRSGAYIIGPVIIGENCDIGPNCFIRPSTAIGNKCHIGAGVELKNTIVMNGSKVPHLSYVGDTVIGEGCNLGAGTKVANLRLDGKEIKVKDVNTHRRKLGAIIGDHVETGINTSINVGTVIGNNTVAGPGTLVHGIIEPNSRIF